MRNTTYIRIMLAAAAWFLWTAPVGLSQTFGRISGTVTDSSSAAVGGAQVVIRNVETQLTRALATDTAGFYVATNLPIGPYEVEVSIQGFQTQKQSGLTLVADGRLTANFQLTIASTSEAIEVTATPTEALNTISGEISRVIDTKQVTNLALNGRNYLQLMTLVPGAVVTNPDQFSVTTSLSAGNQTMSGNRSDTNNLTVDGAFNLNAGSNTSLVNNVGTDFIQEVKLQTSNFSAEYGRMSGAAFTIVTKNGTNQFHGAAFEYFRNQDLDARSFFATAKTPLHFNDFGYDLGGPIQKNKLFFFVGEEWKRLRQLQTPSRVTVPSSALLAGNFAGQAQLYYPGTKNPIPNNDIRSLITTDGAAIANVYRAMSKLGVAFNDQSAANNLTLSQPNPLDFREDIVRLDYHLSDKHSLYGRWLNDDNKLIDPFGTFSGSNLPTTPTQRMRPGVSLMFAETWLPTPTIVNEFRGVAGWIAQQIPPYGDTWKRSSYGFAFPHLYSGQPYPDGIPQVSITSYAGFQGPNFWTHSPLTDIQFSDTVTFVRGSHVLKAGAIFVRSRWDQNGRAMFTGSASFNASGNPNTTGNALADALIGNFRSYTEASFDPMLFLRFSQPEAFVQDSWKVNRKLSLELGLRYQYMQPMYTVANNMANFVPALYDPAKAVQISTSGLVVANSGNPYNGLIRAGDGVPKGQEGRVPSATSALVQQIPSGAPRGLYDGASTFGPRFGFAYTPVNKTVIRGGFGLFYNRPEGNLTNPAGNTPPYLQVSAFDNGNLSNPGGGAPATSSTIGTITAIDPGLKNAYQEQFSLGVQRELPRGLFAEATYVGNLGRHLLREPNINYADLARVAANPSASTSMFVPYLGYTTINQFRSDATSNYHSLQTYVSKRSGMTMFTGGYTWSKCLTDSSGMTESPENYQNRHFNYGPASFDRRHTFSGTFVWSLPRLSNQNAVVRTAAGSWQFSGVIRLQTGPYFSITGSTATGTRSRRLPGRIHAGGLGPEHQRLDQQVGVCHRADGPFRKLRDQQCPGTGAAVLRPVDGQAFRARGAVRFETAGRFHQRLQRREFHQPEHDRHQQFLRGRCPACIRRATSSSHCGCRSEVAGPEGRRRFRPELLFYEEILESWPTSFP